MNYLSQFPYFELQFTKEGLPYQPLESQTLLAGIASEKITDLLVLAHGWNNDMADARSLYKDLVELIAQQQPEAGRHARKLGVVGILWPSKKFADKDLIPGGGAASWQNGSNKELQALTEELENVKGAFDNSSVDAFLQNAQQVAVSMENDAEARKTFVRLMSRVQQEGIQHLFESLDEDLPKFEDQDADQLLLNLDEWNEEIDENGGAANVDGGAAGMNISFSGFLSGARSLLNALTYYQMKERAGIVGIKGLHPILQNIKAQAPGVRLHLVGHSFGARLLSAAVAGPDTPSPVQVDSLILLQAAFSHYGFAENFHEKKNGIFRRVITENRVQGPILITHTRNDKAVGVAYAVASRIARQVGSAIGDKNDFYGGMGGNGAQRTPEMVDEYSLPLNNQLVLKKGVVYNLKADSCIGDHSDIKKPEVAQLIVASIQGT